MSEDNVVPFKQGHQASADDTAATRAMIEILQFTLDNVRNGNLTGIALSICWRDGTTQHTMQAMKEVNLPAMIGSIELTKHDVVGLVNSWRAVAPDGEE